MKFSHILFKILEIKVVLAYDADFRVTY